MFPHVSTARIAALARRPLGDKELLVSDMILLTLAVGLVNAEQLSMPNIPCVLRTSRPRLGLFGICS